MRLLTPLFFSLLCAGPALAADTHPFSVDDMLAMERISDPRVSPDGSRVAFTLRATDMAANRGRLDLWLAATDGSWIRRLTSHEAADQAGRWSPDGRTLYFVSTRGGSAQVWKIGVDGGEAEQVTRPAARRGCAGGGPDGQLPVPGHGGLPEHLARRHASPAGCRGEVAKATGQLYDRLFFRHWDTWAERHPQPRLRLRPGQTARPPT